ncbi:MAG: MlaD family protein [Treponema sp.]|jgi:phospholipid/cholesterol/gamma-HCH transport system substrate-binding protein|nr:MlaD family protein [Treponema sp.]
MKLTIRYADRIVGAFIVLALGIVIFVLFMLGSNQRWFSRDYRFKSYFQSASGLSQNMPVLYKGFTIGRVKSIKLADDDRVEVQFIIFDTYIDRVRNGSLVEVLVSPVSALGGNQFLFYPGMGKEQLGEGEVIPAVASIEGKKLQETGLAMRPERDDSINSVGSLLVNINSLILEIQEAFEGTQRTSLGRAMGEIEDAAAGLKFMAEKLPFDLEDSFGRIMAQLMPVIDNLREFADKLADPDSSIAAILDPEGNVYQDLSKSLSALSGTLENLETSSAFIPAQLPALISNLSEAIVTAQDVLTSLTNNPLLKRGIPERKETSAGGAYSRDLEF